MTSFNLNYPLKAQSPNSHTEGLGIQHKNFEGKLQSITKHLQKKSKIDIILNGERLNAFPLRLRKRH